MNADECAEVGALLASAFLGLDPAPTIVTGPADGGRAFGAGYSAAAGGTYEVHSELLLLFTEVANATANGVIGASGSSSAGSSPKLRSTPTL